MQRRDSSIYGAREGRGKEEAGRPFPAHTARVTQAPGKGHRGSRATQHQETEAGQIQVPRSGKRLATGFLPGGFNQQLMAERFKLT